MKKIGLIIISAAILVGAGVFLSYAANSHAAQDATHPVEVSGMIIESEEVSSDCAAPDGIDID